MKTPRTQSSQPSVVWYRRDLRVDDNPTLTAAVEFGGPVLPVFVWSPEEDEDWRPGPASRWWLRRSLERLDEDLRQRNSGLIVLRGPVLKAISELCRKTGARRVLWSRRYEPASIALENQLAARLADDNVETAQLESTRLSSSRILTGSGTPFQKFTPFYKQFLAKAVIEAPIAAPRSLPAFGQVNGDNQAVFGTIGPSRFPPDWEGASLWRPGSAAAHRRLETFLENHVSDYKDQHDRMDDASGTSHLSPHLSFGEISARRVWHMLEDTRETPGQKAFMRQLVWREFASHQLTEFPEITDRSLRGEFDALATSLDDDAFTAWKLGRTGYPVVDAGMRELAETGWMHNRARMVVASFLIKHLALPWQWGAHWFWENLVDADLANNSLNWQWVAGSAVDASPYYRIFNPQRQGARFDPDGDYVRRWVDELRSVSGSSVHGPRDGSEWNGIDYPEPIVEHESARQAALDRYAAVRAHRKGA